MNELVPLSPALPAPETRAPALIAASGEKAERRFWEFFTVTIRNPNTRRAYRRAAAEFCAILYDGGVDRLTDIQPLHVAAYVELLGRSLFTLDRESAPGRQPHALRLARGRSGAPRESRRLGARAAPCGQAG